MKLTEDSRKDLEIADLKLKLISMQAEKMNQQIESLRNQQSEIMKKFCLDNNVDSTKIGRVDIASGEVEIIEDKKEA
jgi:hypothetical protein